MKLGFGKIWASENMNGGIKMQQEKSTISELIMDDADAPYTEEELRKLGYKIEKDIYSEKYNIKGKVIDYFFVTKLFFEYEGRKIEMGIQRNILKRETYEEVGLKIMETYISNLALHRVRKLQLHFWYIGEYEGKGKTYKRAHGIVSGSDKFIDSMDINTSSVQAVHIEAGELVVTTKNSVYYCPLEYCRFDKQDEFPDIIPEYEKIKEQYKGKRNYPSIESGKVLLVLANFCEFYFHSLYYVPLNSKDGENIEGIAAPNIGMFQDSYLIQSYEDIDHRIDIRYFPHFQNIEFYSEETDGCPLYIENIGDVVIYAKTHCGVIKLEPGDRKEVTRENAEKEILVLPNGDLYPARLEEE